MQPITCDAKHGLTRKATADEVHQLSSVTQSLGWIARQTHLDLSYRILRIQSTCEHACVRDPCECNRIVQFAFSTSTRGPAFSCADAVVATISDVSFCQDSLLGRVRHSWMAKQETSHKDVRLHGFFVQLNPPLRDQPFSFTGHVVANVATKFAKQTGGALRRNAKNTTIQQC